MTGYGLFEWQTFPALSEQFENSFLNSDFMIKHGPPIAGSIILADLHRRALTEPEKYTPVIIAIGSATGNILKGVGEILKGVGEIIPL